MSYLSYDGLLAAITDPGLDPALRLRVEPFDPQRLRSASLELHIGSSYARWRHSSQMVQTLGPKALTDISEQDYDVVRGLGPGDRFVIRPGESLLVAVDCWLALGAGLLGFVHGKSSIGRAAQIPHTAGLVEPGWVGVLTLEPINMAPFPVVYEVGMPLAQLCVAQLDQPTSRPYGHPTMYSRYQGQSEVTPPRRFAVTPQAYGPTLTVEGR